MGTIENIGEKLHTYAIVECVMGMDFIEVDADNVDVAIGNREIFFITERKNKTDALFNEMSNALGYAPCESLRRELRYYANRATIQARPLNNGKTMLSIRGDCFSSMALAEDENMIVIKLD